MRSLSLDDEAAALSTLITDMRALAARIDELPSDHLSNEARLSIIRGIDDLRLRRYVLCGELTIGLSA